MKSEQYWGKEYYVGDVASTYLEDRKHENVWHIEQNIVKEWLQQLPKGCSVLDLPVGTGRFLNDYIDAGLNVYGADISQDMLNQAYKTLGDRASSALLQIADAENLPFSDQSIDYITCVRLFHLLPLSVLDQALAEFLRVARYEVVVQVFSVRNRSLIGILHRLLLTFTASPVNAIKVFFPVLRSFARQWLLPLKMGSASSPSDTEKSKTFTHEEIDLLNTFGKHGFTLLNTITVDERASNPYWVLFPSRFYFLSKEKSLAK